MKLWSVPASLLYRIVMALPFVLSSQQSFSIDFKIDMRSPRVEDLPESALGGGAFDDGKGDSSLLDGTPPVPEGSRFFGLPEVADIPLPPLPDTGHGADSPVSAGAETDARTEAVGQVKIDGASAVLAARDPFESQLGIYETTAFPVPGCLVPNVAFWKKIYRDVSTAEALIHDRDKLNRIFGKLRLPTARGPRARALKLAREHFGQRLESLARKVEAREALTISERELLATFEPEDRNAPEIRDTIGRLRIQSGLQERFSGGVRRSLGYLPTITPILKQYGVPKDIVHLPHVESSYVRTARSKVGAVGLWQIMPETMRRLMGTGAVAKRTHLTVSTRAAAKLLQQNYRMLKSWPLALTAYNHGAAGVSRGVRQTGSRDICTLIAQYNSRSFKFASSNFYAQFLAARHVALDEYKELAQTSAHRRVLQPLLAHASREKL